MVDFSTKKSPPKHFWEHLIYVGLSRVPSLQGLHVVNLNTQHIHCSEKVKNYLSHEKTNLELCYQPMYDVQDSIKIVYSNVCSIAKKWNAIVKNHNINACDLVILAETWLSTKSSVHECYNIEHFHQMRMDSTIVPSHRGLLMYLKKDRNCSVTMNQSPSLEMCRCDVPYRDTLLSVFGIYRPPSSSLQHFKEELFRCITACNVQSPKIILGDFNIDIKKNINHSFLQEMQQRLHLTQFIDQSTTFEGTTIDLVFSNLSDITAVALPNMWSSHHTLNTTVPK